MGDQFYQVNEVLYDSVLITGGGGMLARAFIELLQSSGVPHVAPPRAELDITSADAVDDLFQKVKPTLVINCAAYTKVDLAEKEYDAALAINGVGPGVLANACRVANASFVHFSTDYVFDGTLSRPLQPGDPVGPRSAYGRSKLEGERAIQKAWQSGWLILRTAWLYGVGGPSFPRTMVNAARAGKPLKVVTDQVGSPTYTVDLATATLELLEKGVNGIHHVANAGQTNWRDFAEATLREFGIDAPVGGQTSADWKAIKPDSADRPAYSVFDLQPLERLLGRPMPTWQDALHRFRLAVEQGSGF
jgi:dTDP-4-dehydrorhamnose reductase